MYHYFISCHDGTVFLSAYAEDVLNLKNSDNSEKLPTNTETVNTEDKLEGYSEVEKKLLNAYQLKNCKKKRKRNI